MKDFVCLCGLLLRLLLRIDAGVIAGEGVTVGSDAGASACSGPGPGGGEAYFLTTT